MSGFAERDAATLRVVEELKRVYKTRILPIEQLYRYDLFNTPLISDAEFDSKPQVLLVGQYSVGKTTFIRYLLGRDWSSIRIGPEPTTDRFTALMDGPEDRVIYGNSLAVMADMPYKGLERFGNAFLGRFEGVVMPSNVLKNITLIDTPGVLSGEKQRVNRGYDFCQVVSWFASRCDLIILLFDAHKLDISDEFRNTIDALKGNDDKIRCILNKADQVDRQKLMRVYGALMWSIGKVVKTPEVMRVYCGSFWDQPLQCEDNATLFEMEERDLMRDLKDLPRNSTVRKINELVKRVRSVKVHAYIIGHLKEQMPYMMGIGKKQKELIGSLGEVFKTVLKKYNLAAGDFPNIDDFRSVLKELDFTKFQSLKPKLIDDIDSIMGVDFPRLMDALPSPAQNGMLGDADGDSAPLIYEQPSVNTDPFADDSDDDGTAEWDVAPYMDLYMDKFNACQVNGAVTGAAAKTVLGAAGPTLPKATMRGIWALSDIDKDGTLDKHEFALAMFLIDKANKGEDIPSALSYNLIPHHKR
jgi:EH domain-containing protein 1